MLPHQDPPPSGKPRKHRSGRFSSSLLKRGALDPGVAAQIEQALSRLDEVGDLAGEQSKKLSVRVDPGVLGAASRRVGTDNPTDVVNAALALLASPDPFVRWFLTTNERLPEDFDLAI